MSGKVFNCPTCDTRIIMSDDEAKETMARATTPGTEVVPEGTEDLEAVIIDLEATLTSIANANRDDAWIRGRASLAKGVLHHVVPRLRAILTRHRATPPGAEAVPDGTVELLGKICARFLEIEYQHELNQPHIGDGVMYEMLEDLNSILATRIIDMVREHDGNHIANAGKMVKIGDFTLSNDPPIDGKIWINRKSGEGGSFDLGKFEAHIEAFYQEHF